MKKKEKNTQLAFSRPTVSVGLGQSQIVMPFVGLHQIVTPRLLPDFGDSDLAPMR